MAANGANYVVAVDGSLTLVYGTSASAPVFGSIITLINEARAAAGKGSVGFINPTIYANPTAFNDIVSGTNKGCGTKGFTAVKGWDPATRVGDAECGETGKCIFGVAVRLRAGCRIGMLLSWLMRYSAICRVSLTSPS